MIVRATPAGVSAAFALLLLGGCEQDNPGQIARQSEPSTPAAPSASADISAAPMRPQAFVSVIGEELLYGAKAAEIALDRTRSNGIRDYATRALEDYRAATEQLQRSVGDDGELILPEAPGETHRADLAALGSRPSFDSLYLQQQRRTQERMLGDLRRFAAEGRVATIRRFAADTEARIEAHRRMLRDIVDTAGADGRAAPPDADRLE